MLRSPTSRFIQACSTCHGLGTITRDDADDLGLKWPIKDVMVSERICLSCNGCCKVEACQLCGDEYATEKDWMVPGDGESYLNEWGFCSSCAKGMTPMPKATRWSYSEETEEWYRWSFEQDELQSCVKVPRFNSNEGVVSMDEEPYSAWMIAEEAMGFGVWDSDRLPEDSRPFYLWDLMGRVYRCACRRQGPSTPHAGFFKHRPDKDHDTGYCGCEAYS